MDRGRVVALILASAVLAVAGCSDDGGSAAGPSTTTRDATSTTRASAPRPEGPAAELTAITAPGTPFMGAAAGSDVPEGYDETEFVAAGTATAYEGPSPLTGDGLWTFTPTTTAPYRTRVVLRRPTDPEDFSGTVVVEWLNVSGGLDANPDYAALSEEVVRRGHAWVGVSAQLVGVAGGPVLVGAPGADGIAGKGLVALNPERYGTLMHPGDGYSFDIFTQVARAVRAGDDLFGGARPDVLLAAGQSQSAIALTTYYDGVQPLARQFDGFLVHSRAFVALPLVGPGQSAELVGAMTSSTTPVLLRGDQEAPVLELQTEGDVVGVLSSADARQDDTETFRLWEVAGTSHADRHLLGPLADRLACGVEINDGPLHVVAKAALRALDDWVRTGTPPPTAPRLELTDGTKPAARRDDLGIAVGGIRTPPLDVPVRVLSGEPGPSEELICLLMGSTRPLDPATIAARYPSRSAFEETYAAEVDRAVEAGFLLEEDREAMEAYAHAELVGG